MRNLDEAKAIRAIQDYNMNIEPIIREMQSVEFLSFASEGSSNDQDQPQELNKIQVSRVDSYQPTNRELEVRDSEVDSRYLAYSHFISNDQFIKTHEFESFLYQLKGKAVRETVDNITDNNEGLLLETLRMDIEQEMRTMTHEKGRKLLGDVGVLIFPRWDLKFTLVFDSFLHNSGAKHKLSPEGVTQVFIGSGYNQDEHALWVWAMYPPHKKPLIVDTKKAFRHVMTFKVGQANPIATANFGINIAKLNKAQTQLIMKENDALRARSERFVREIEFFKDQLNATGQTPLLTLGESTRPKDKNSQLKEENQQLRSQLTNAKFDVMLVFIQKRFKAMMTWIDK